MKFVIALFSALMFIASVQAAQVQVRCSKPSVGCSLYGADGCCTSCSCGYSLDVITGYCVQGPIANCQDANSDGKCLECCPGYYQSSDGFACASSQVSSNVVTGTEPSCLDLGYNLSFSECTGKKMLRCPFDRTQVKCF